MDSVISQLKQDFYSQIRALQVPKVPQIKSSLSLLTEEEIQELEAAWIELTVWKRSQTH